MAGGITSYAIDRLERLATFALGGRLFVCDIDAGDCRQLAVGGPVFDPRPDPAGQRIAYVSGHTLCIAKLDGSWGVIAGADGRRR